MRKKIILIVLFLPTFIFADFDISQYKFQKNIISTENKIGDFSFKIDSDIYKNGNQFLHDVRVIDKNKVEIPYKIENELNRKFDEVDEEIKIISKENNTYILDLGKSINYVKKIKVETESKYFSRVVDIYGSHLETSRYEKISKDKGSLIFSNSTGIEKNIYLDTDYRFIKLIFFGEDGNFDVKSFLIQKDKSKKNVGEKEILDMSFEELKSDDKKEQNFLITVWGENIPIYNFSFIASENNFSRKIQIFSSDKKDAKILENKKRYNKNETYWKEIFQGSFSKKKKLDNQEFKINDNKRYYLLIIQNGDDKKISIDKILATRFFDIVYLNNLDFQNNSYEVFYGNIFAKKPEYDIDNIKAFFKSSLKLGEEKNNSFYVEPKKDIENKIPYLIYFFIGLIILILFWFTYKILRETSGTRKKKENNIKNL